MGFFDKAKTFLGGHGVTVAFTRVEKQQPDSTVTFPLTDTVFKANFNTSSKDDAKLLSTKLSFIVKKKHNDGRIEKIVVCSEEHTTGTFADELKFPHDLKAGEDLKDSYVLHPVDIPKALKKIGYDDPTTALGDDSVTFYIHAESDVEGSPFDPEAKLDIQVTA